MRGAGGLGQGRNSGAGLLLTLSDGNTKTQTGLVVAHNCVSSGRVGHFSRDLQTPGILLNLPTDPQGFLAVPKLLPGPLSR